MIAPEFNARPRGQQCETLSSSAHQADTAHTHGEEHFASAHLTESRGLARGATGECSSTTSSNLAEEEHARTQPAEFSPPDASEPRLEGADPRKAAVRLPEFGAADALEVPENARRPTREPPLFSLSGGWGAPSIATPTMPAHGVGTPATASVCLQPAEGGEGSVFRGAARPPQGAPT